MPSGYTAAIGDDISFNDFVMRCARAMGALVSMRDEPWDALVPERFEPGTYHLVVAGELTARLDELYSMTEAEAEQAARDEFDAIISRRDSKLAHNATLRKQYEAMLERVEAWQPPSDDHEEFKRFMRKQIQDSIAFDCNDRYYLEQEHQLLAGAEWLEKEKRRVEKDLNYHAVENEKEIERTEARNTWLKLLRESLA